MNPTRSDVRNPIRKGALAAAGVLAAAIYRGLNRRSRRESDGLFRRLFEQCPVGIAVLGRDQSILYANRALCALLGHHDALPPGLVFWDLVHPDDAKAAGDKLQRFIRAEAESLRFEMRCAKKQGAWIWTRITTIRIGGEPGAAAHSIAVLEDISSYRETEANLIRSNTDLALYASVASHDLQEPVRKIITYGQLLAPMKAYLPDEGQAALTKIRQAAMRMRELIEDLLEYSRVNSEEVSVSPVDLNVILKEVLLDLGGPLEESRAKVKVARLPEVEADALQMRLLFQNLISNAVKFVRPGEAPDIDVRAEVLGAGLVRIDVKDHGIGFDERFLSRLFKPFQRLCDRNEYEGSGIGLAICKAAVERHGGSITASGELGKGACFSVVLPIRRRKA